MRPRCTSSDALLAAGRQSEAREWFGKAVEADKDGSTDASDRLAELDGVEFLDAGDADDEDEEGDGGEDEDGDRPVAMTEDDDLDEVPPSFLDDPFGKAEPADER